MEIYPTHENAPALCRLDVLLLVIRHLRLTVQYPLPYLGIGFFVVWECEYLNARLVLQLYGVLWLGILRFEWYLAHVGWYLDRRSWTYARDRYAWW